MALQAWAWSPRQSTMSGKEDGDKPSGCNTAEILPSTTPANTPRSHGIWMLLQCPSPEHQHCPHPDIPGLLQRCPGRQPSAPGGKGIRAGGDGRQAGAQPQGLKKVVPKMSGEGCLSLRGHSRERQLPLHPTSHIPRPAPCLSSRRLSRLANPWRSLGRAARAWLYLFLEPNQ